MDCHTQHTTMTSMTHDGGLYIIRGQIEPDLMEQSAVLDHIAPLASDDELMLAEGHTSDSVFLYPNDSNTDSFQDDAINRACCLGAEMLLRANGQYPNLEIHEPPVEGLDRHSNLMSKRIFSMCSEQRPN